MSLLCPQAVTHHLLNKPWDNRRTRPQGTLISGLSSPGYRAEEQTGLRSSPARPGLSGPGSRLPSRVTWRQFPSIWTNVLALPIPRVSLFLKTWHNNITLIKTIEQQRALRHHSGCRQSSSASPWQSVRAPDTPSLVGQSAEHWAPSVTSWPAAHSSAVSGPHCSSLYRNRSFPWAWPVRIFSGVLGTTLLKAGKGKGSISCLGVWRKGGAADRICRIRQFAGASGWRDPSEVTACPVRSGLSNTLTPVFIYTLTNYWESQKPSVYVS